jgi:hypothetical protein
MSTRITQEWTNTLIEAYGNSVNAQKGQYGERLYYNWAKTVYPEVIYHEQDRQKQLAGIDIEIKKPNWSRYYSVDVKTNINTANVFVIDNTENGWLRSDSKMSDRICHINQSCNYAVEYDRKEMIVTLDKHKEPKELLTFFVHASIIQPIVRKFHINYDGKQI